MARVVLEVGKEKLMETLKFIRDVFSGAQIERIEQIPYGEKKVFHITFRVELTVMTIIDTLDFYKKLDLLKLIEGV